MSFAFAVALTLIQTRGVVCIIIISAGSMRVPNSFDRNLSVF